MSFSKYAAPAPRAALADPELVRPDWTTPTARDPKLLWLDKNENADPQLAELTTRVVADVVTRLDPKALSTYPESGRFYLKLAKHLNVGADRLLLAAGSDGVIRSVFEAFISPGDRVLHSSPTFAMYPVYGRMYGANTSTLDYQSGAAGPLLTVDAVLSGIARVRPKLVCLPNPDSPTGTVFEAAALRRIIEAAGDVGALILVDEAYHPFCEITAAPWVDEYEHLVVARTFAKAWGLAGMRIGYAIAAPSCALLLHKVRPLYEVNTLAVAVMERMLDHSEEVRKSVQRLNDGRDRMLAAMESLGFRTVHAQGNFMHVAFGDAALAVHAALKDKVLYRLDHREACLKGFTRFTATTAEGFEPLIKTIEAVVARMNTKQKSHAV
jgi:histidinol-phosphate aminotransferase